VRRPSPAILSLAAALLLPGAPAAAQQKGADPAKLREMEAKIKREREAEAELKKRTEEIRAEIRQLRDNLVAGAAITQNREAELSRLEAEVKRLEAQERAADGDFQRRQAQLSQILAALQRITLRPPATLLAARSEDANDTVRGALLLRSLVPELENRAKVLRQEIEAYAALRQLLKERRELVGRVDRALGQDRRALALLMERKAQLLRDTEEEQDRLRERLEKLTRDAATLREFLQRVQAESAKPEIARGAPRTAALTEPAQRRAVAAHRGKLTPPAQGRLISAFKPDKDEGQFNKGVLIEARKGAQAVAPFDGQVMFAGPFRGYGRILIIDHGDGYLSVLTGLERTDAIVKQWVLAGEPVGAVGAFDADGPRLYYELRHQGRPINPAPWLAVNRS
jgi:septal ring factor EnvC (AmiA/AmiB activator)